MFKIVHFEVLAENPPILIDFYKKVFGWEITKWEWDMVTMEYWMVMSGPKDAPGINGGLLRRSQKKESWSPTAFVCTIEIPNIDEYMKKVTNNWGKIVEDKVNIPWAGWLAYCNDPEWNKFWIIEASMQM